MTTTIEGVSTETVVQNQLVREALRKRLEDMGVLDEPVAPLWNFTPVTRNDPPGAAPDGPNR